MTNTIKGEGLYIMFAKEDETIGCGYTIVIRYYASSFTAFRTQSAFDKWLDWTGLEYDAETKKFSGSYKEIMEMTDTTWFFQDFRTWIKNRNKKNRYF